MINKIKKIGRGSINFFYRLIDYCIYKSSILQRPKYNKKYSIVICAIFKDEARFLKEWIEYHELIGVEHFYLYNNNSTDNYKEVLSEYIESGLVTLIDWPHEQGQISAYKHFHDTYWKDSQWISFLDIDEFFVPKKDLNLLEWIKKRDKYPVLLVYWKMFGSNGMLKHDDNRLCIEQYLNSWEGLVRCGKCIINTDYSISLFDSSTHHRTVVTKPGNRLLKLHPTNAKGHIVVNEQETVMTRLHSEKFDIQINHYWSKGWDVYDKKRSWSGDVFFKQNPKNNIFYFIKHELRNTSIDWNIQRFLLLLKWKMLKTEEYQEMLTSKNSNNDIN